MEEFYNEQDGENTLEQILEALNLLIEKSGSLDEARKAILIHLRDSSNIRLLFGDMIPEDENLWIMLPDGYISLTNDITLESQPFPRRT